MSAETQRVIEEVSKIVSEMAGIQLGSRQQSMVENRLKSRLLKLGISSFSEYLNYLKENQENESQALVSLLTTHHTYFFREFSHFEYLLNRTLNQLVEKARQRSDKTVKIWSAACSRGQEVYSLAMFFNFHLSQMAPDVKFHIWGTDIDPESVSHAENGVYRADELKQSPAMYVEGHWIRGQGEVKDFSKVRDHLKSHCSFTKVNLLDCNSFLTGKEFDLIFCRNVFIYFNASQIQQITRTFLSHLDKEGHIVLGVSETLNGLGFDLELVGPSIYRRKSVQIVSKAPEIETKKTVNILSVDDSVTILALLKKIMAQDPNYHVTATANNGRQALEILKKQKFDIITLDLHMPELDGLGFLKEYKGSTPVLIVSSINRDDTTIAQKAISLGASDYVEKPSLENLVQAGNEIRSKIKTVLQFKKLNQKTSTLPSSSTTSPIAAKVKVLIVDDSATIRNLLTQILSKDKSFEVVAQAERPSQVESLILQHRPDVITLDINMPEMDGVTLLSQLHPKYKIPTVMISSISKEEGPHVLRALEIGAVDYIQKPQMSEIAEVSETIRERLKIAAKAKVGIQSKVKKMTNHRGMGDSQSIILIGASTGGTEALRIVLESLPSQIPPIVVVQHIPPMFSAAFAQRLNTLCPFSVKEAVDGDLVLSNQVLIAPGGKQMGLQSRRGQLSVSVNDDPAMNRHRPSVDYLFKSAVDLQLSDVVAVILTGMGGDGARQMKALREQGARTIAQDEKTCVVYGMPREAVAQGGVEFVLPLDAVAEKMLHLCVTRPMKKTGT